MLFTNDVDLVDKNMKGVNLKLKMWRNILETNSFKLNRVNSKYLKYNFSFKAIKN